MMAFPQLITGIWSILLPTRTAPGVFRTKAQARSVVCTRLDQRQGAEVYPDVLEPPPPRGEYFTRGLEVCTERMMRDGLREARDEAVLSSLQASALDIARATRGTRPDLADRTFQVEVHYPSSAVATKIRFATQNALMAGGARVSDKRPLLTPEDVFVLSRLDPGAAYAGACERYRDLGALTSEDALVAVVVRDPRQTTLQAGVCADGRWMWVQ